MSGLESGFCIGDAVIRPVEGLVDGPCGRVRIEPKAMAVLLELARNAGEVCSREQLQQTVWPRGFTTDDVLTRCIGQIRKALGDDPKRATHIETLPRRGYRLLSPIARIDAGRTARGNTVPATEPDRLIVLPFQYLASASDSYVADGIVELLTAQLSSFRGLRVISRTTAMHFKDTPMSLTEVAERTGADLAVEGSVLQAGSRVQVVVQLIDTRTDLHIWAEDYVRDIGDLLVLQNEIAKRIAAAIRLQAGAGDAPTPRPAAVLPSDTMLAYLRGRDCLSQRTTESLRDAVTHFSVVCASVPDYAPAWASRAEAQFMLTHYGADPSDAGLAACRADLDCALGLDPNNAIALACRGVLQLTAERDTRSAEQDLLAALASQPGYSIAMLSLANLYAIQGRFSDATNWLEQALLVDPLDVGINMNWGDHLILQRRYDDAIAALDKALELAPAHRPAALRRCWALSLAGQATTAARVIKTLGPESDYDWQWHEYAAIAAGASDDRASAGRQWRELLRINELKPVSPWSMARGAAAAGDREASLDWLRRAQAQNSTSFPFAAVTPAFDTLRNDPAFKRVTLS